MSDMHHRISGVSASIRSLIPGMSERFEVFFVANQDQGGVKARSLLQLYRLLKRWPSVSSDPVWHVRRNNEMTWGLLFRRFVNPQLKLIFTNSAIRNHSRWPRWLISKMDAVMVTSKAGLEFLPNAVSVVPHGVDIKRFEISNYDLKKSESSASWSHYQFKIGIVGRVRPEKGTDLFSTAMCTVLKEHRDACAVIVGNATPKYADFLADLKKEWVNAGVADQVFVLGEIPIEAMPSIYSKLDIVCAPARYEGYGLVPLEAMVSGTAVVASKTGAYAEMIEDGENGFLIECGEATPLAENIERLVEDANKLTLFKLNGSSKVRNDFSIENEIEGICQVYNKVIQ